MHTDMIPFLRSFRPLALFCIVVAWAFAANAQEPDERDLQALRFYINENNEQAIQSELRRLQIQFPAWSPPEDLGALNQSVSPDAISRIYQLIADADYAGARDAIAQTSNDYPNWSPPSEMLAAMSLAEAQTEFDEAIAAGNVQAVIRIARASPLLLSCERVNNAWLLAEQYMSLGDTASALIVYRGIVGSCSDPSVLTATLEKSAAVASPNDIADLADTIRTRVPSMAASLTAVENRLRAGMGATPRVVPGVPATGTATVSVDDTRPDLDLLSAEMRPSARPSDLGKTPAKRESTSAGSASRSSGGSSGGGGTSRGASAAARGDWQGCLAATANSRSATDVSQRGWCAFNAGRPMQALRDFRAATANAGNATLRRDSAYGMALTMLRLKMVNEAASVAASTNFTSQQRLEVESQILDSRGVAAYQNGQYRRAIGFFDEYERLTGTVRRDLAMLRGYAYLNSGQKAKAVAEFRRLHDQLATPESRSALSTALR